MGIARHSFHAACAVLLLVVLLPAFGCSDGGDMYVAGGSTGGSGGTGGGSGTTTSLLWSIGTLYDQMQTNTDLIVLDCRKNVADSAGIIYTPYDVEHIDGAHYIDFFVFGDPYPNNLPGIITTLSDLGISTDTPICLYDEAIANPQGKVFFNLERLGCTNVHLLDGGIYAWKQAQGPISVKLPPSRTPTNFTPKIDNTSYATLTEMKSFFDLVNGGSTAYTLTDFREPPLYYGHKICPDAARHGHMPNCGLLNWQEFFDSTTGFFKTPAALEALCITAGMNSAKTNIVICNKGWRTGIAYFVCRHMGWPREKVIHYVGGIREWTFQDPVNYPMVSEACYEVGLKMPPGNTSAKRFAGAFAQVGAKAYCAGGYLVSPSPGTPTARHQAYDIANDSWEDLAELPETLTFSAGAAVGDYVYVMGGLDQNGSVVDTVYRYDTVLNSWDNGGAETPLPVGRFSYAAAAIGDKIYVCGGLTDTNTAVTANYSAKVYAYDTVTQTWDTSLPDLPQGRRCHTMVALGDMLYVLGGFYYDDVAGGGVDMRDIRALDTLNIAAGWKKKADMPMDLAGHVAAVANDGFADRIYVLGGWSLDGIMYDVIEFDPALNQARILKVSGRSASIGWPRYWYFIGAYGEKIASIGGFGGAPSSIKTCQNSGFTHFHQTYVYDVTNSFDP